VFDPAPGCPEPGWQEVREFFCPCPNAEQLAVEVVPPGYPVIFEMLPDLDTFYREILGKPLPDEAPEWYADKTSEVTAQWAGKAESEAERLVK
jgi:acetone carboxylase gamma subunit